MQDHGESTITIYNTPPSCCPPSKSHYTLNLRDVFKVFQGVMVEVKSARRPSTHRLCATSAARLRDRLVDNATRVVLQPARHAAQGQAYGSRVGTDEKRLLFGDFEEVGLDRVHDFVPDMDLLIEKATAMLGDHNAL